ncbi:hypothetical protein BKA69DRAFT_1127294 [Paraphysoderma sedebokerense]|nr:hypothetical protein BKA69DRAFT_1127294 [Paraphysoderma sedebokerense]
MHRQHSRHPSSSILSKQPKSSTNSVSKAEISERLHFQPTSNNVIRSLESLIQNQDSTASSLLTSMSKLSLSVDQLDTLLQGFENSVTESTNFDGNSRRKHSRTKIHHSSSDIRNSVQEELSSVERNSKVSSKSKSKSKSPSVSKRRTKSYSSILQSPIPNRPSFDSLSPVKGGTRNHDSGFFEDWSQDFVDSAVGLSPSVGLTASKKSIVSNIRPDSETSKPDKLEPGYKQSRYKKLPLGSPRSRLSTVNESATCHGTDTDQDLVADEVKPFPESRYYSLPEPQSPKPPKFANPATTLLVQTLSHLSCAQTLDSTVLDLLRNLSTTLIILNESIHNPNSFSKTDDTLSQHKLHKLANKQKELSDTSLSILTALSVLLGNQSHNTQWNEWKDFGEGLTKQVMDFEKFIRGHNEETVDVDRSKVDHFEDELDTKFERSLPSTNDHFDNSFIHTRDSTVSFDTVDNLLHSTPELKSIRKDTLSPSSPHPSASSLHTSSIINSPNMSSLNRSTFSTRSPSRSPSINLHPIISKKSESPFTVSKSIVKPPLIGKWPDTPIFEEDDDMERYFTKTGDSSSDGTQSGFEDEVDAEEQMVESEFRNQFDRDVGFADESGKMLQDQDDLFSLSSYTFSYVSGLDEL